jgi:hypothetical protein
MPPPSVTLMIETVSTSETSVYVNETTRIYVPERCHLHENLRSHLKVWLRNVSSYQLHVYQDGGANYFASCLSSVLQVIFSVICLSLFPFFISYALH